MNIWTVYISTAKILTLTINTSNPSGGGERNEGGSAEVSTPHVNDETQMTNLRSIKTCCGPQS